MRLNKIFAVAALTAVSMLLAMAQPRAELSMRLRPLGPNYNETITDNLQPIPFGGSPTSIQLDLSQFGNSPTFAVQVQVYVRLIGHNASVARGISLVNAFIDLRNTGLTVYDGFTEDEAGLNDDDRKNAKSLAGGVPEVDGAGNGTYRDNAGRWYNINAPGQLINGPLAFGAGYYTTPYTSPTARPMFTFVVLVPRQVGVYNINFARVQDGGPFDTREIRMLTLAVGQEAAPRTGFYQYNLTALGATIEVIPEPASMIALGSGLVGLLALRRRKK